MSQQFEYDKSAQTGDGSSDIDIKPLIEPFAICLIVVGSVLLIVAVIGICGSCFDIRVVLSVVSLYNVNFISPKMVANYSLQSGKRNKQAFKTVTQIKGVLKTNHFMIKLMSLDNMIFEQRTT